jgi:tripartite-type tricarboxylate transporter receptor subunit TctC
LIRLDTRKGFGLLPSLVLALLAGAMAINAAVAQSYPAKPIKLVNPLGAGGTAEALARTLARQLSEQMGQPVVVETKSGAAGTIGAEFVAKSAPDGYTLLYGVTGTNSIAPSLYAKLGYDAEKDLEPISITFTGPNVLVVNTGLNLNSLDALVAYARAKPGELTFASAGNGSMSHLNGELFKSQTKLDIVHVPYKGGGAAVPDLLSGRVAMMIETGGGVPALLRSGKVKALAVTTKTRVAQLPDVPTFAELGFPGMGSVVWGGLFAPAGTPRAIIEKLAEECARAARTQSYRDQVAALANDAASMPPDQFKVFVREEIVKYGEVIRRSGMKAE